MRPKWLVPLYGGAWIITWHCTWIMISPISSLLSELLDPCLENLLILVLWESSHNLLTAAFWNGWNTHMWFGSNLMDSAPDHFRFRHHVLEDVVSDEVHVQWETVGSWVTNRWVGNKHAIFSSNWITDSTSKALREYLAISQHDPTLSIDVKLSVWNLLAKSKLLPVCILKGYRVGLVSTCPYDYVSLIYILSLLIWSSRLYKGNSLLLAPHNSQIEIFRVTSETTERIQIAILFAKLLRFKLVVTILFCIWYFVIENLYLLSVQDLDTCLLKLWKLTQIKLPVIVVKQPKADTETAAVLLDWDRAFFCNMTAFLWGCHLLSVPTRFLQKFSSL